MDDEELIHEIREGSRAAMEVLVKRHYKSIFSYVYRKTGDYHISFDLTQEVFVKMMNSLGNYRDNGKFSHWLLKIAVNHCMDYFRGREFKQQLRESELTEEALPASEHQNVWNIFYKRLQNDKVRLAIQSLPEHQRDAVILNYYNGLKIKEVAELTGSNESTVKSRIRLGITKLKEIIVGGERDETYRKRR
ncbi:RNA polymerase sigma-70 factor (ECF subfamily) [Paenibacillus xylanexedens]|uniref:RNA polymerase sigma factor n=1 Tax=Paenibacillus xylanexedens TaxID=528191 RepID=UPI0020A1E530|nr:sigma-70 family RNA polymerase sigma factor [Paenibacillus xylanexedens]MCP1427194.1 RNA polymerase sigma-70 factor (ECF subfamily) [Paenibacillus xylanexedens]